MYLVGKLTMKTMLVCVWLISSLIHMISDGCRAPPVYPTMVLADRRYLLQKDFPEGSQVRYTCGSGYTRAMGNIVISHCEGQQWTPINLKCERKSCGSAGEILNGHHEYFGVLFRDMATAVCRDGFTMIGRNYRQCQDQGWDGGHPVCEAVKCADPPEVVNGERTGELEGPFEYRTVIRYQCRQGQLIGRREIYCTQNGTWSAPPPECIDVTCSSPSVKFGSKTSRHLLHYKYGDYVSFQCDEGYRLNGESKAMCGRTGQWTPLLPECSGCVLSDSDSEPIRITGFTGDSVILPCACTDVQREPEWLIWTTNTGGQSIVIFSQRPPSVNDHYKDRVQVLNSISSGNLSLRLSNITLSDRGFYRCEVDGDYRDIILTVREKGCVLSDSKEIHIAVFTGDSVVLPCACTDVQKQPEQFIWTAEHWGQSIVIFSQSPPSVNDRYKDRMQVLDSVSPGNLSLHLSDLTLSDGGSYRCEADGNYRDISLTVIHKFDQLCLKL